jgi:hypothetical protein
MSMSRSAVIAKKAKDKKRATTARTNSRKHIRATGAKRMGGIAAKAPAEPGQDDLGFRRRKPIKMEVKAEDGKLIITLPRFDPPTRSGSGKSFVVATTGGVKRSSLMVDGFPVQVVASAFFYDNGGQPPVQWVPLLDLPRHENDDDDDDEADEEGWNEIEELT